MAEEESTPAFELASSGGQARAKKLTAKQRKEIATAASDARWGVVQATHSGELKIGEVIIPCAVLEDGTRVLTQEGFLVAIGRSGKPAKGRGSQVEKVAPFLDLDNLKPFVDLDLADSTKPIVFKVPTGGRAYGYKADLLPRVCEVYLKARDAKKLLKSQEDMATACDMLMRSLAHVGIVALVDEATGFQDHRAKDALAKILEAFVAKELQKWMRTFQPEFYKEMFRLRGLPFNGSVKRPQYIGHLTNDLIYARLAPGVLEELRVKNPERKVKHFQWLTAEVGHPKLSEHLTAVTVLMKVSDSWDAFKAMLDKALPKYKEMPLFKGLED